MEYTKDMILQVRYGEVNRILKAKKQKRTSRALAKLKKHRLVTAAVISAIMFIGIDMVLITNFIHIFSMV